MNKVGTFKHCDYFEGCPDYYQRVPIRVHLLTDSADQPLDGTAEEEVWVYVLRDFQAYLLDLPHHENYDSYGPHGLQYLARYEKARDLIDHKAQVKVL